jgi:curved DNA-binding protein
MEFQDYYKTLGVARDATAEDIKKAFRKLARKFHPDVSKASDAELRMRQLNEAYAVLSDPEKRAAYDQLERGYQPGHEFRPPPDWGTGFEFSSRGFSPQEEADFSDFFAELFGHVGGAAASIHTVAASSHVVWITTRRCCWTWTTPLPAPPVNFRCGCQAWTPRAECN